MSKELVKKFQKRLEDAIQYGGTRNETSIRSAFQSLLSEWAESHGDSLRLVPEVGYKPKGQKNTVYPDGTLKDSLQQNRGYWESKDENDTLDDEITKKFAKGYPKDNIIFEDSRTAILIQHGQEVTRVNMEEADALTTLLQTFFAFVPEQVTEFRRAIEHFKDEMPHLLKILRDAITAAEQNKTFVHDRKEFIEIGQEAINPEFSATDAGEMLIQHILTGDLFRSVFDNAQYHEDNNVAQQLQKLADTFYTGPVKRDIAGRTKRYYGAIQAAASHIADHHEKQRFLKVLYENFYRAYNPAGADRLGIFYTPGEIVRFMIEATDTLLERHFKKGLADKGVEILDPATGTGTFITELIDYLPRKTLEYKYANELHCNELALLPYYIANLNIEATYAQKMGKYAEFRNIVLVDTLDNTGFGIRSAQNSLFGSVSAENLDRVKRQNDRPVRVIIGNPPYRANQANENDNNKNREYPQIDRRIKETYVAASRAQKTKLYDMYSRFLRWATDRLKEDGIVAFVMNRSFIDSRTFDGFRKLAAQEYTHIYVVDLGGDVRANPKLSGPKHNVFAIQTGIAIAFLIKKTPSKKQPAGEKAETATIQYARRPEMELAREKLAWLAETKFKEIEFENIVPDDKFNWVGQSEHSWDNFIKLADKNEKTSGDLMTSETIFWRYSLGVASNRDEWAFDISSDSLKNKIKYFIEIYEKDRSRWKINNRKISLKDFVDRRIKWTSELEDKLDRDTEIYYSPKSIIHSSYRPFYDEWVYFAKPIIHRVYQMDNIFGENKENKVIAISGQGSSKNFQSLATEKIPSLDYLEKTQVFPIHWYDSGRRVSNIPPRTLKTFAKIYKHETVSREDIFHYVYAVLHHPAYREKYALNLKQEFPRIPFYDNFPQWVAWGRELMDLHIGFETVKPFPLKRKDIQLKNDTPEALKLAQKAKLKVVKDTAKNPTGAIELDGLTTLSGVPAQAWAYRLGNRSALEWVLERHKETTPKDPTIREQFNTYRFADHKERVIDLLARVTTVSMETMRILGDMPDETL
ncbi:type ISP restriction/modification enzyme [Deinococcus sp. LM3]|uniref:type ISP restriction/modification enzyme n=1 Tax=Deinococcus sp. LM3 TaxID=1938608 RepID=UPI000992A82A|nr:type ISP restriction/modification enzyme [Deinococcus sp. LM3]OOV14420.1 DNA methyltransferase [Deinococcus sp. LM3]